MSFEAVVILLAAVLTAAAGRIIARWNPRAGVLYAAILAGVGAWMLAPLRDPMALLMLLVPGAAVALWCLIGGLVVAMVVTLSSAWGAAHRRRSGHAVPAV